MVIFCLDFISDTHRDEGPIKEIVIHDLLEKPLTDKVDHRGILDGRGLAVDAFPSVCFGIKKVIFKIVEINPREQIQRQIGRKDIVHRMQHGQVRGIGIGSDRSARHPVMAVHNQPSLMFPPDRLDDVIDDLPLKFGCGGDGISGIGAQIIGKDGRADQMDLFGVDFITDRPPSIFIQIGFPLETFFQIKGSQMHINASFQQPFTEC